MTLFRALILVYALALFFILIDAGGLALMTMLMGILAIVGLYS